MLYNPPVYNYIGSKLNLLSFIQETIEDYTGKPLSELDSIADLFCGTGAVTYMFMANQIKRVVANDLQYYAYILTTSLSKSNIDIAKLKKSIAHINREIKDLKFNPTENDFVTYHFTEHGPDKRKYFTQENGARIDYVRKKIESMKANLSQEEYNFMIKCLLHAVIRVSNITCVYGAFLKSFKDAAKNVLNLPGDLDKFVLDCPNTVKLECMNCDIFDLLASGKLDTSQLEVVYLDPPYSKRRYDTSYHVLETIALYDSPVLRGITGLRPEPAVTHFSHKTNSMNDFDKMFSMIKSKYLFVSYSSDGNVSKDDMIMLLSKYFGNVKCYETFYKRAKTNISKSEQPPTVKEYIFAAERGGDQIVREPIKKECNPDTYKKEIFNSMANICDEFSKIASMLSKVLRSE